MIGLVTEEGGGGGGEEEEEEEKAIVRSAPNGSDNDSCAISGIQQSSLWMGSSWGSGVFGH